MNELSFFDSIFNDVLGTEVTPSVYHNVYNPRVDVLENKEGYTLEMELPGRNEKDVNIELDHDNLTINSVKCEKEEKKNEDKKCKYILKERRCNEFTRRFTLPSDVDTDSIAANFKNGVLTVTMRKKEIEAPKQIAIAAS